MKLLKKLLIPLILAAMTAGCSGNSASDTASESAADLETEPTVTTEKTAVTTEAGKEKVTYDAGGTIPVLAINTVSSSDDVMDFVTKPVATHVSKSIATWTPGYKIPPAPYYEKCTVTLTDSDDTVLLEGAEADVKVRGNWTTSYDKKPLRIKFTEKQNMLGMNGGAEMKNWVLMASYKDGSLLRDKTVFSVSREILGADGLYSADAQLVEVTINGEYWGVYLLTEFQQINPARVDITEAEKDYTGTDIGYFMEYDGYYTEEDELHGFFVDYNDNAPLTPFDGEGGSGKTIQCLSTGHDNKSDVGVTIKSDIYSQEQHDFIESYVNNVYKIMYEAAYNDTAYSFNSDYTEISEAPELTPQQAVENVVDVQSLADIYIINELACDADIYWSSFFMDADFGAEGDRKLRFEAPWDFDSALGNKDRCVDGTGFYAANIVSDVNDQYKTINPWLTVLMYEDWYQDIIREKWTSAYDSGVFDRAFSMISDDTEQYQAAFERNYSRWNNLVDKSAFSGELSRAAAKCKTQSEAAEYLLSWLETRVEFMNTYWHE